MMRRSNPTALALSLLFAVALATAPTGAVCLATGKVCRTGDTYDDSVCCLGMVCGWGGVCQAGCQIDGNFYRMNSRNPANPCERCIPRKSTVAWTNLCAAPGFTDAFAEPVEDACMIDPGPGGQEAAEFQSRFGATP